jgi:hypothetical protein
MYIIIAYESTLSYYKKLMVLKEYAGIMGTRSHYLTP